MKDIIIKFLLVSSLFLFFSIQGIYEETIYGNEYISEFSDEMKIKFRYREPNINLLLISLASVIISGIIIFSKRMNKVLFSFKDKFILGFLYTAGKYSSENSYKYIDYISKQISKSMKCLVIVIIDFLSFVPGIGYIIETLIGQQIKANKISKLDIIKGFLCTLSIFLFSYHPEQHKHATKESNQIFGYILIIFSLISDGLLGLKEKLIKSEVKLNPQLQEYNHMTSWYFMFCLNLGVLVYMVPIISYHIFINDEFSRNLTIYLNCPELLKHLGIVLSSALIAQIIVFQILQRYGPLSLAIYTGTRKIINIFLSIIWFEKEVSFLQKLSLLFGFLVVILESFEKSFVGEKEKREDKDKNKIN